MAELTVAFLFGFVIASIVWLGVWLLLVRPAHASSLAERTAASRAAEASLAACLTANQHLKVVQNQLQAENKAISAKLDDALKGWGRCIRSAQIAGANAETMVKEEPQ